MVIMDTFGANRVMTHLKHGLNTMETMYLEKFQEDFMYMDSDFSGNNVRRLFQVNDRQTGV